jgi:hypothetical protein
MAEVKSTLELVMERTRHMTLSEEDKREQVLAEFKKSLGGLLQKVQDEVLSLEQFKTDLKALQESSHLTDRGIIIEELTNRMDLDRDNAWALNLLTEAFALNSEKLASVFREYRQAIEAVTQTRTRELKKDLLERHAIGGSAVVPNCTADPEWAARRQRQRERLDSVLMQAVAGLKGTDRI